MSTIPPRLLAARAGIGRVLACLAAAFLPLISAHADEITIALAAEVTSLDPHHVNLQPNNNLSDHLFDKLVMFDPGMRLRPGLAESWRVIDDTTWEFKLRRGIRFHDGTEFTAEDVAFSLDRPATLTGSPGGFTLYTRPIVQKTIVDPYTIRLTTATPYPNLPVDMAGLAMLSKKAATGATSADFDSGKAAVGTGPWRLVRFARGDRIELARNDAYWDGRPHWDKATFRMITTDATRTAALLNGEVQMIEQVATPDLPRIKARADLAVSTIASYRMIHFHLDSSRDRTPFVTDKSGKPLERNPFLDIRVRRAFSKAIDRNAIVERVMEGVAIPASQFIPEGFFGHVPGMKPEAYDPAGARRLLAEAGYPDGFAITLHGPSNRYVNDEQIVQAVAQMLSRVGITARVETMPMSVYLSRGHKQDFSAALLGWGVVTGEASFPLRALVATVNKDKGMGTFNWGRYSNPRMDQLLDQGLATVADPAREALLRQATEAVLADYGLIPLHNQLNVWATRSNLLYTPRIDERTYAHEVRPVR